MKSGIARFQLHHFWLTIVAIISDNRQQSREENRTLSEVFSCTRKPSFSTLAPLPSNVEAIEAGLLFSRGMQPFVSICGPSGVGKSEILAATKAHTPDAALMSAEHYLSVRARLSPRQPLIIDDCQELLGKPRRMVMFRSALDRRVRGGCPTMLSFTCNQVPKNDFVVIPQSKRWAKYVIDSPDLEERFQLINHVAKQEQMELSPVLCHLLAKWLGGTGRGILGALHRLKLEQTSWTNSRDALRACGILDAYLGGDPQWDLRHRVIRTAKACEPMFPHIDCRAMACYTLIRTATLCEHSVAQFLSQSPGSCYSEASCFAELRRSDPAVAQAHHQFVEIVLDRLLR